MENINLRGLAYDIVNNEGNVALVARMYGITETRLNNLIEKHDLRRFKAKETRFNEKRRLQSSTALFEKSAGKTFTSEYDPPTFEINNIQS